MDVAAVRTSPEPTALSLTLPKSDTSTAPCFEFCGKQTAARFGPLKLELRSLLQSCGVFDLGWRTRIAVRGEDRLRWLSGMVTNAVQQLGEGEGNYSFFLNAQGRIQGDAFVYRDPDQLWLDTTCDQVEGLIAHLDRYIIMDDVSLEVEDSPALGLAGPQSVQLLRKMNLPVLQATASKTIALHRASLQGIELNIALHPGILAPKYEIFCAAGHIGTLWQQLLDAGAAPCGFEAVESLRILEGIPRYRVDITDRDLPQETGQERALNFNKGCYLGQEIVERIRSRGAVHRRLRQFALHGDAPILPADLVAEGTAIGKITSFASLTTASGPANYALGIVRTDALNKTGRLTYNGGEATALDHIPAVPSL